MPWTESQHVTGRWVGPDAPDDEQLLTQLIDDAEGVILFEYPEIDDRIVDDPPPDPLPDDPLPIKTVQRVVASMVIRHLRNPDGARQIQETEGPFSRGRTIAGENPGELWLSDRERELLGYLPGAPSQRAFTVPQDEPSETLFLGGGC